MKWTKVVSEKSLSNTAFPAHSFHGLIRFANHAIGIVTAHRVAGGRYLRSELHGLGVSCYMTLFLDFKSAIIRKRRWGALAAAALAALALGPECPHACAADKNDPRVEIELAGPWEMAPASQVSDAPPANARWREQIVPMLLAPPAIPREQICLWYRRSLQIPKDWKERRIQIHLEGADAWSRIYWNGKKVASEFSLNFPVTADVTAGVQWGAANELLIAVSSVHGEDGSDLYSRSDPKKQSPLGWIALYPGRSRRSAGRTFIGLSQPIRLLALNPVHVKNTFVRTSYRKRKIEVDVWIENEAANDSVIKLSAAVEDRVELATDKITIPAGETRKITLADAWEDPELWSIGKSSLHTLDIAVRAGTRLLDAHQTSFGFREFWRDGPNYYLNGGRLYLAIAAFPLDPLEIYANKPARQVRDDLRKIIRERLNQNYNTLAWWYAAPKYLRTVADQEGILVSDFIFDGGDTLLGINEDLVYTRNLATLSDRFIPANWNHPSVLFWTLHSRGGASPQPKRAAQDWALRGLHNLARHVQELDPTRFVNSEEEGDSQPAAGGNAAQGEKGESLNQPVFPLVSLPSFPPPGIGALHPANYYWAEQASGPKWDRTKPLLFTDMSGIPMNAYQYSGFLGQAALEDPSKASTLAGAEHAANLIIASRIQGLSGVMTSPMADPAFLKEIAQAQSPQIVLPREFNTRFYAGEKVSRRVHVINGLSAPSREPVQWALTVGKTVIKDGSVPIELAAGEGREVQFQMMLPPVGQKTSVTLALRYDSFAAEIPLTIYPPPVKLPVKGRRGIYDREGVIKFPIAVYDPSDTTLRVIQALAEGADRIGDLAQLEDPSLLILGEKCLSKKISADAMSRVRAYVEKGGRVLLMQQQESPPEGLMPVLLKLEPEAAAHGRAFIADTNHPVMADLTDADFRFWHGDHTVSRSDYIKPTAGSYRILVESTGPRGLTGAALVHCRAGAGLFLGTQLDLVDKAGREPVAGLLLQRLISYLLDYQAITPTIALLVASENGMCNQLVRSRYGMAMDLTEKLDLPTLKEYPLIMVDGSEPKALERLAVTSNELKIHVAIGNTLVWHRLQPDQLSFFSEVAGRLVKLQPAKTSSLYKLKSDALLAGISNMDVWYSMFAAGSASPRAVPAIQQSVSIEGAEELASNGSILRIPIENGKIYVSQVLWDAYTTTEKDENLQDRQDRYLSLLLSNLGILSLARVGVPDFFNVSDSRAFLVDLRPLCNRGFRDEVTGDGKGGWADLGSNDMRNFPTRKQRFQGVPFDSIVPHKNGERSCIVADFMKDRKPLEIPVASKAKRLFLLHASVWPADKGDKTYPVAQYKVHYEDGSTADFEAVVGATLHDWMVCKKPPANNGFIAWVGRLTRVPGTPQVTAYIQAWDNPTPGKGITSLTFTEVSQGRPHYILIAITAELPEA